MDAKGKVVNFAFACCAAFALGDHLLMPLRQQRGFAKSSAGADDAQPALLNGTEKLKQPGALQQLY